MGKMKSSGKLKKIVNLTGVILSLLFFIALFIFKDKLTNTASDMIKMQAGTETVQSVSAYIDSTYDYTNNGHSYQVTFLEFGSSGCSACKRMEKVMEDIRLQYPEKVNVVFYNITSPKNRKLMKYYGISVIPTQVLLDSEGEEFFRHTGYIPTQELIKKMGID
jgi:thioredoxin 1